MSFGSGPERVTKSGSFHRMYWSIQLASQCATFCQRSMLLQGAISLGPSKFGTKSAALKADPTKFLIGFGWSTTTLSDVECMNAEKYLVQVLSRGNHSIETLDDLRFQMYHQRKTATIIDLPPTSHAAKGHILRAFYAVYIQMNCLENISLNSLQYGFQIQEGNLEPKVFYRPLSDHMSVDCRCVKCATSRCPCREDGLACCAFCKCQTSEEPCRNPNGVVHGG